jgi:hypothetical protein
MLGDLSVAEIIGLEPGLSKQSHGDWTYAGYDCAMWGLNDSILSKDFATNSLC